MSTSIKLDDIMKVIIFFETMHCLVEMNKKITRKTCDIDGDTDIVKIKKCNECEKCVKKVTVNQEHSPVNKFNLGYILLDNKSEAFYDTPQNQYYIKEIYLVREENETVYNLMLPDIGIIPDNKIIFTNNLDNYTVKPQPIGTLDYYSNFNSLLQILQWENDEFIKFTLFNHNGVCSELCNCRTSYTVILKKINKMPEKYCVKYLWKN